MKKLITLYLSSLSKEQIKTVFKTLLINNELIDIETAKELQDGLFDKNNPYLKYAKYSDNYEWIVHSEVEDCLVLTYDNFISFFNKK